MKPKIALFAMLLGLGLFAVTLALWWNELPARVATHFDAAGKANGWMSRTQHTVGMALLAIGIPAVVLGVMALIRRLPPTLLNVPKAAYWRSPEHYPEACRLMQAWSYWFSAAELLWATALNYEIVQANLLSPPTLSLPLTFLLAGAHIACILALIVVLLIQFSRPRPT